MSKRTLIWHDGMGPLGFDLMCSAPQYTLTPPPPKKKIKYVISMVLSTGLNVSSFLSKMSLWKKNKHIPWLFFFHRKISTNRNSWVSLMNRPPVALSVLAFAHWAVLDSRSTAFKGMPNSIVFGVNWQPEGAQHGGATPKASRLLCVLCGCMVHISISFVCEWWAIQSLNMILWTNIIHRAPNLHSKVLPVGYTSNTTSLALADEWSAVIQIASATMPCSKIEILRLKGLSCCGEVINFLN